MTISVELETPIGRTVADTFAQLVALERWPEWMTASGISRVERPDADALREGSRFTVDARVAGRATRLDGSVTALDAPSRLAIRAKSTDGISLDIDAALASDGAGSRVRWSVRIGLPLRVRWLEGAVAPEVRRAMTADLAAFRRRLESVAG